MKGWLGLAARVVLGAVLIVSGATKTSAPKEEFAVVIEAYDLVPADAAQTLSALLPWAELTLGFALVFGFLTPLSSAAGGLMMLVFIGAILSTKARGIELPNCGCFGGKIHPPPLVTAAIDAVLVILAAAAWRFGGERLSLDNWAGQGYTGRK